MKILFRASFLALIAIMTVFAIPTVKAKDSIDVMGRLNEHQPYSRYVKVTRGSLVDIKINVAVEEFGGLVNLLFMYSGTTVRAISTLVGLQNMYLSYVPHSYLFANPNTIAILRYGKPFTPKRPLLQLFRQGLILPGEKDRLTPYLINLKVRVN
jgi:hypothetical protein